MSLIKRRRGGAAAFQLCPALACGVVALALLSRTTLSSSSSSSSLSIAVVTVRRNGGTKNRLSPAAAAAAAAATAAHAFQFMTMIHESGGGTGLDGNNRRLLRRRLRHNPTTAEGARTGSGSGNRRRTSANLPRVAPMLTPTLSRASPPRGTTTRRRATTTTTTPAAPLAANGAKKPPTTALTIWSGEDGDDPEARGERKMKRLRSALGAFRRRKSGRQGLKMVTAGVGGGDGGAIGFDHNGSSNSTAVTVDVDGDGSAVPFDLVGAVEMLKQVGEAPVYNRASSPPLSSGLALKIRKKPEPVVVTDVHELRAAILDDGILLKDIELRVPQMPDYVAVVDNAAKGNDVGVNGSVNGNSTSVVKDTLQTKVKQPDAINYKDEQIDDDDDDNHDIVLPFDHEVLRLIARRASTNSTPGRRDPDDTYRLALALEGGGMRGAVSAGMASAIACLGLCDAFDVVYGSSAGSIVGAYMISRQMCVDVYTDVLPAAKKQFVCTNRLITQIVRTAVDYIFSKTVEQQKGVLGKIATKGRVISNSTAALATTAIANRSKVAINGSAEATPAPTPGMNISFVLDGIMCPDFGLRPLDLRLFRINDKLQPLRVASSVVRNGKMEAICFGSDESDFFDTIDPDTGAVVKRATVSKDGKRQGLFTCLQAGMTVPAATGAPVRLVRSRDASDDVVSECFDAFCYEPIPYRSAVQEGATHVLALRTRPDGFAMKTKPTVYESLMAPQYFHAHGLPQVAEFFKKGGQQYIYVEDVLTLDEGRDEGCEPGTEGVAVPPPAILYGAEPGEVPEGLSKDRSTWKKAHLLPVALPRGTDELSTISQDKDAILQAIRDGFAAAFDLLAPAAGLNDDWSDEYPHLSGRRVAELVFPKIDGDEATLLGERNDVPGDAIFKEIEGGGEGQRKARRWALSPGWIKRRVDKRREARRAKKKMKLIKIGRLEKKSATMTSRTKSSEKVSDEGKQKGIQEACPKRDASTLLSSLPGIQSGKLSGLVEGLRHLENS